MSSYLYDKQIAAYLRSKANRSQAVSASELVYFLMHSTDLDIDAGIEVVDDFLARREKAKELVGTIEQIQHQKQEAERDALIASLRLLARREKRRQRLLLIINALFMAGFIGLILSTPVSVWFPLFFGLYMLSIHSAGHIVDLLTNKQEDIGKAKALAQYSGTQSVGILAEALIVSDVRVYAAKALIRELPKLKASDANLLNDEQRKYLHEALMGNNLALIYAILKALEQVGDEKAIPYVERLAEGRHYFGGDTMREAAKACLPYLHERVAKQKEYQTLLRASSASEAVSSAPNILLRPAQYTSTTEPQELLRASAGEE